MVIYGLIEVFQRARRQYRDLMPIEDIEVRSEADIGVTPLSRKRTMLTEAAFRSFGIRYTRPDTVRNLETKMLSCSDSSLVEVRNTKHDRGW